MELIKRVIFQYRCILLWGYIETEGWMYFFCWNACSLREFIAFTFFCKNFQFSILRLLIIRRGWGPRWWVLKCRATTRTSLVFREFIVEGVFACNETTYVDAKGPFVNNLNAWLRARRGFGGSRTASGQAFLYDIAGLDRKYFTLGRYVWCVSFYDGGVAWVVACCCAPSHPSHSFLYSFSWRIDDSGNPWSLKLEAQILVNELTTLTGVSTRGMNTLAWRARGKAFRLVRSSWRKSQVNPHSQFDRTVSKLRRIQAGG